jgi:hypothetical protein
VFELDTGTGLSEIVAWVLVAAVVPVIVAFVAAVLAGGKPLSSGDTCELVLAAAGGASARVRSAAAGRTEERTCRE